jgi:hypothetical protein
VRTRTDGSCSFCVSLSFAVDSATEAVNSCRNKAALGAPSATVSCSVMLCHVVLLLLLLSQQMRQAF